MKRTTQLLTFLTILSLTSLVLTAQTATNAPSQLVPRLVNFSGKATDVQGKAISGVVGATFGIYRDQTEGSPLWVETQNVQTDARGNYVAQLGATKPEGLPLDLFTSGEARWLGVTVNGGPEQPRILLLSVPYALKAADADTVGGLPASAFVLAVAPSASGATASSSNGAVQPAAATPPPASSNVTTAGGTVNKLPLWSTATDIENSALAQTGTGATAKIGINTTAPAATLDVAGSATVRGNLSLPSTGVATPTAGKNSQPETFSASAYNSGTKAAVTQSFGWQAEPIANNTASPNGSMNLLFASGSSTPAETGLRIGSNGQINFAAGQKFPGTGTVTSVGLSAPSSDFTVSSSPVTGNGTLALNWTVPPNFFATPNAIVKRDSLGGADFSYLNTNTLSANSASSYAISASTSANNGAAAIIGNATALTGGPAYGVQGFSNTSAGVIGINQTSGVGVQGVAQGSNGVGIWGESTAAAGVGNIGPDGVHGVAHIANSSGVSGFNTDPAGTGVYGSSDWGFNTPNNVHQDIGAYGWVKAMVTVNALLAPYDIDKCYNSQLHGAAAITPPCGIILTETSSGNFTLDFGFDVSHSFFSTALRSPDPGRQSTMLETDTYSTSPTQAFVEIIVDASTQPWTFGNAWFDLVVY